VTVNNRPVRGGRGEPTSPSRPPTTGGFLICITAPEGEFMVRPRNAIMELDLENKGPKGRWRCQFHNTRLLGEHGLLTTGENLVRKPCMIEGRSSPNGCSLSTPLDGVLFTPTWCFLNGPEVRKGSQPTKARKKGMDERGNTALLRERTAQSVHEYRTPR